MIKPMSLDIIVNNLLSGITDPHLRIEIARTIYFLRDVYLSGRAGEEEILKDLIDLVHDILVDKEPLLDEMERREKAKKLAEDILRAFRREQFSRRLISKYRMI